MNLFQVELTIPDLLTVLLPHSEVGTPSSLTQYFPTYYYYLLPLTP